MEDRPTQDSNAGTPAWAQAGDQQGNERSWERTPPPPPGAELEPGEQSRTLVSEEQQTGTTEGYSERGPSAVDAEMGAEPGTGRFGTNEGERRLGSERDAGRDNGSEGTLGTNFQDRWREIQAGFVDDPRSAVEQADQFFEEVLQKLNRERQQLRGQWDRGDQSSTEDMRVAMQRYRDYYKNFLG